MDPPCNLIAEIHSVMIYLLRTIPFHRAAAISSLVEEAHHAMDIDEDEGVPLHDLVQAISDIGNNWERVPLKQSEGRFGWEDALAGCLKDVRIDSVVDVCVVADLVQIPLACHSPQFPPITTHINATSFRSRCTNCRSPRFAIWIFSSVITHSPISPHKRVALRSLPYLNTVG